MKLHAYLSTNGKSYNGTLIGDNMLHSDFKSLDLFLRMRKSHNQSFVGSVVIE